MSYASAFESVQPSCFDKLTSEALFAQIPAYKIRHNDYLSEINEALSNMTGDPGQAGTLGGVAIEVMMPSLAVEYPNPATPLVRVTEKFIVKENHQIAFATDANGIPTGINLSAETVCQNILQTFHSFYAGGGLQTWQGGDDAVVFTADFHPLVAYEVTLTNFLNPGVLTTVPTPGFSWTGDTVTISCQLGGAQIYYTTDGTFPGPGNYGTKRDGSTGTAALYTGPVILTSGVLLMAAAYATGLNGSDVRQQPAP